MPACRFVRSQNSLDSACFCMHFCRHSYQQVKPGLNRGAKHMKHFFLQGQEAYRIIRG